MTRLPTEDQNIVVADGPQYKVGPNCATPYCTSYTDHAHHLVRRSFLGGDYAWVQMPDGVVIGNLAPLCATHHSGITENRFRITYDGGVFYWDNFISDPLPLTWQPPLQAESNGIPNGPVPEWQVQEDHVHTRPVCQACGQKLPKPKVDTPQEEAKLRKTWAVSVPVDHQENGADVLDSLLEAAREELSKAGLEYGEGRKVKYHILATALGLFVQHSAAILSNE